MRIPLASRGYRGILSVCKRELESWDTEGILEIPYGILRVPEVPRRAAS